jgi:hypothetical protein
MLTEILDQWEVLVELQRQQNTWQQRWDRAQSDFQFALQQLDPHDADRLARVLAESLPAHLPLAVQTTRPLAAAPSHTARPQTYASTPNASPAHSPPTHPARTATHDFAAAVDPAKFAESLRQPPRRPVTSSVPYMEQIPHAPPAPNPSAVQPVEQSQGATRGPAPSASTTAESERHQASPVADQGAQSVPTLVKTKPAAKTKSAATSSVTEPPASPVAPATDLQPASQTLDEAAILAGDEDFVSASLESSHNEAVEPAESTSLTHESTLTVSALSSAQMELLQWATETIGDGLTENELFQSLRKSPFAGQARQLFELLRERDAFYETDEEIIYVHSLKKMAEYQQT